MVDLPYIESQADASIEQDGLRNRCRFEAHDMFKEVPAGGDIYLLRFILHDWNDDESRQILKTVRAAMPPAGRVLIVEMLVPETNEPGFVQLMDINMLVMTGGRERTATEYGALCAAAGLRLVRTIATGTPFLLSKSSRYSRKGSHTRLPNRLRKLGSNASSQELRTRKRLAPLELRRDGRWLLGLDSNQQPSG